MIKANELRIGNALAYGAHGLIIVDEIKASGKIRVAHTEQHSISLGYSDSLLREDDLDPIPLTEEWLERMGFTNRCMRVDEYSGMRIDEKGRFELMDYSDGQTVSSWDHRIEFVHQLQNLFFALSGEELTIKQLA